MYRPEEIPIRPNVDLSKRLPDQDHWFKVYRWDYRYYNFHLPYTEELPEDFTLQRVIAEYYGMTTWVDDAVGRMLAALDANGLAEDTIVVFTSDHGDYLGSHGRVQKGDLHEESVRIPLIVRTPSLAAVEEGAAPPLPSPVATGEGASPAWSISRRRCWIWWASRRHHTCTGGAWRMLCEASGPPRLTTAPSSRPAAGSASARRRISTGCRSWPAAISSPKRQTCSTIWPLTRTRCTTSPERASRQT